MEPPGFSELCEVCMHINFAAILTPREWDEGLQQRVATYRPEYNGSGKGPYAAWAAREERRTTEKAAPIYLGLPKIRTVDFDELSNSSLDDYDDYDDYDDHDDLSSTEADHNSRLDETDDPPDELRASFAADLSDIEDDEDVDAINISNLSLHSDENENGNGSEDSTSDIGSVSTWSGTSHFTENERIDLNKQAAGDWDYCHGQLYYLGSIWDVRSRRARCALCSKLWTRMKSDRQVTDEYLTKSRCVLKLMELKGRRRNESGSEVATLMLTFIYGYKIDDPQRSQWIVKNPFVFHGTHRDLCNLRKEIPAGQIIPFNDKYFGEARWCNSYCDFELLKAWLNRCETKHDHAVQMQESEVDLRLIDVRQMCLVDWQGLTEDVRYVALSYVWGTYPQNFTLTLDELDASKEPGFLDRNLNQTITDAIELVKKLGEQYLWIDSLCIVQDSPNDKLKQIPQMHQIYGRALFTIVAAWGDDADAGLPGVSPRGGNHFKLELEDIRVSIRGSTKMYTAATLLDIGYVENYIRGCAYSSRGWTFQEGILSPRVLVFTKDLVYWECERCTWNEGTHWESDEIDFVGLRAIKNPTPTDVWNDRFERNAYDMRNDEEKVAPVAVENSYASMLNEYSGRELRYEADVLHACDGVLSSIKHREQTDFVFGLRTKHIGNDLLFNLLVVCPRRTFDNGTIQTAPPSWSWAAWKGPIHVANKARNNSYDLVQNLKECNGVKCYVLSTNDDGNKSLCNLNKSGGWRFEHKYVRRGEGIYDLTDFHPGAKVPPADGETSKPTIPIYRQDLMIDDINTHPAFDQIIPNFHIIFRTFSTLVTVRLEYDEFNIRTQNGIIAGTKMTRGNGMWDNRNIIQRKVYACRRKKLGDDSKPSVQIHTHHDESQDEESSCPCCGKDTTPEALPEGYELGPYLGRLPPLPPNPWDAKQYLADVPDGLYLLLWMNNNELPMFGHLLCKPLSASASKDGEWEGEILQRVSGVVGPTQILTEAHQQHYCAEWGTFILG